LTCATLASFAHPRSILPDPRGHVSAAVLDGKIYALGADHGHDITQIDMDYCHGSVVSAYTSE